jgi:Leucine-rich repeat (LRR) protein
LRSLSLSGDHFPTSFASAADLATLAATEGELDSVAVHGAFLTAADLEHILEITHLEAIDLTGLPVSADLLGRLARAFPHLRRLSIGLVNRETHRFTPLPLEASVLRDLTSLARLDAIGLRGLPITDGDVPAIPCLSRLSSLDLGETHVTASGVSALAAAEFLRDLWLDACAIGDDGAGQLGRLRSLESLDLSFSAISDAGVAALAALPRLERLRLKGVTLTSRGVQQLGEFARLRELDISSPALPSGIAAELVERQPALRDLTLFGVRANVSDLETLASLRHLASLRLDIDGAANTWSRLSALPALTEVSAPVGPQAEVHLPPALSTVRLGRATAQGIERVFSHDALEILVTGGGGEAFTRLPTGRLPRLRELAMQGPGLDDEGLARLAGLPNLQALYISGSDITDRGVAALERAPYVHTMELRRTRITDASCTVLSKLAALHCLDVPGTGVTAQGIATLSAAANLQSLALDGTQLTDASADALARVAQLVEIYLYYGDVTAATIARLAALPRLMELNLFEIELGDDAVDTIADIPALRVVRLIGSYPENFEAALRARRPQLVVNGFRADEPPGRSRRVG